MLPENLQKINEHIAKMKRITPLKDEKTSALQEAFAIFLTALSQHCELAEEQSPEVSDPFLTICVSVEKVGRELQSRLNENRSLLQAAAEDLDRFEARAIAAEKNLELKEKECTALVIEKESAEKRAEMAEKRAEMAEKRTPSIFELAEKDEIIADLKRQLGVTEEKLATAEANSVTNWRNGSGRPKGSCSSKLVKNYGGTVEYLYSVEGRSMRDISKITGISLSSVVKIIKDKEIEKSAKRYPKPRAVGTSARSENASAEAVIEGCVGTSARSENASAEAVIEGCVGTSAGSENASAEAVLV